MTLAQTGILFVLPCVIVVILYKGDKVVIKKKMMQENICEIIIRVFVSVPYPRAECAHYHAWP